MSRSSTQPTVINPFVILQNHGNHSKQCKFVHEVANIMYSPLREKYFVYLLFIHQT